jgi:hypothetical protein
MVRPGGNFPSTWTGWTKEAGNLKPTRAQLIAEVCRRDPTAQPKNWSGAKAFEFLKKNNTVNGDTRDVPAMKRATKGKANAKQAVKKGKGGKAQRAQANANLPGQRWSSKTDTPRLANCIRRTRQAFLRKDATLSRGDLDSGRRKAYWVDLAKIFNNAEDEDLEDNEFEGDNKCSLLNLKYSGYIATGKKLEQVRSYGGRSVVCVVRVVCVGERGGGGSVVSASLFPPLSLSLSLSLSLLSFINTDPLPLHTSHHPRPPPHPILPAPRPSHRCLRTRKRR